MTISMDVPVGLVISYMSCEGYGAEERGKEGGRVKRRVRWSDGGTK